MLRETTRVSFLMCPFCVRGLLTKATTELGRSAPHGLTCRLEPVSLRALRAPAARADARSAPWTREVKLTEGETWTLAALTLMTSSVAIFTSLDLSTHARGRLHSVGSSDVDPYDRSATSRR
jgi:hypothetical protein